MQGRASGPALTKGQASSIETAAPFRYRARRTRNIFRKRQQNTLKQRYRLQAMAP